MTPEQQIRDLLIDSCHSVIEAERYFLDRIDDPELLRLLFTIARDEHGHLGDAPMQAAYFISQHPSDMLAPYESDLMAMLPKVDGYAGHVALALGKTRSVPGRQMILRGLAERREPADGEGFDAWLFEEALSFYE